MAYETYEGSKDSAYLDSWNFLPEKTYEEELEDYDTLVKLRKRSNWLCKNDPAVKGAMLAYRFSIHPSGLKVSVDSESRIQKDQAQEIVNSFVNGVDVNRSKTLGSMFASLINASFRNGDALINVTMSKNPKEKIKTHVEIVDASRIQTPSAHVTNANVRNGVKYDADGKVLGYFVKKRNALGRYLHTTDAFHYLPAYKNGRKVCYLFKALMDEDYNSSRQVPMSAHLIMTSKLLGDYKEAIVVGARVAACFSAFIITDNPAGVRAGMTKDSEGNDQTDPRTNKPLSRLKPGTIVPLKKGQKVEFASPNNPGDNVRDFIKDIQYREFAMSIRFPYEILFLDLSNVNYSSWRGGSLEIKKVTDSWRAEFNAITEWIISFVLEEAIARGYVRGSVVDLRIKKRWPSAEALDQEKTNRANKLRLENGTASVQMLCDEQGLDYEEVQKEIFEHEIKVIDRQAEVLKRKKEYEEEYGIVFPDSEEKEEEATGNESTEEQKERRKEDGNW